MRTHTSILAVLILHVLGLGILGQSVEKDWHTWGREDTLKILNSSAWAKQWNNFDSAMGYNNLNDLAMDQPNSTRPAPPVILRIYSSLTVRKALLRLRQFQANYDKLDAASKTAFDDRTKAFLECSNCESYYVLILLQPVDRPSSKSLVWDSFKDDTLDILRGKATLVNDKGERRELEQFVPPKDPTDPAIFYFRRQDGGTSLVGEDTKKVTFQFKSTLFRNKAFMQDVSFDVSKTRVGGKIDL